MSIRTGHGWEPLFGSTDPTFDRLFQRFLNPRAEPSLPLRVTENSEGLVLESDLPGVKASDVEVTAEEGRLTIRAVRPGDDAEPTRRERRTGSLERTLSLSDDFDLDAIEATHRHGRLTLRVPRREETKPRRIAVKS